MLVLFLSDRTPAAHQSLFHRSKSVMNLKMQTGLMQTSSEFGKSLSLASIWRTHQCQVLNGNFRQSLLEKSTAITGFHLADCCCEVSCLCDANKTNAVEILRWRTMFIIGAAATFPHRESTSVRMEFKTVRCRVSWRDNLLSPHAGFHLSNQKRLVGRGRAQGMET